MALISALILAAILAVSQVRAEPNAAAIWYAAILAAPYIYVAAKCLSQRNPASFVFGFSRGLANVTRIGIIAVMLATPLAILAFVFQVEIPWVFSVLPAVEAGASVGGPGFLLLSVLLVVQFPIARVAKRNSLEGSDYGVFSGFATLLLPVGIILHQNTRATQKSVEESAARDTVARVEFDRRSVQAREIATKDLHLCVQTGCVDSLRTAASRDGISIDYQPRKGGFLAKVAPDKLTRFSYVTDETGIVLRTPLGTEKPSDRTWGMDLRLVDSVFLTLKYAQNCLLDQMLANWDRYPQHLAPDDICYLRGGDTSLVSLHGAMYRVIYSPAKGPPHDPRGGFELAARPIEYAKPAIRSFLVTEDSSFVTTADRRAKRSDPVVEQCEWDSRDCR